MYADPAHIRKHQVKVALSDHEVQLLDALCAYTGEQKGSLLRQILIERANQVLHEVNSGGQAVALPGLNKFKKAA